jgi:uncharacterized membrane protein
MNIKRILGTILTILGIGGLIYAALLFVNNSSTVHYTKALIIYSIIGLIFLVVGINLIRTIKDES